MIDQLRGRYGDVIHPLDNLEIDLQTAKVRLEYIDRSGAGRRGAFRVHPRLPVLQIWPNVEIGLELIRAMEEVEEEIVQRIRLQERLRDAKEEIVRSRSRGEAPRQEDWSFVQESRIPPPRTDRRLDRGLEGRTITLKDIERAVAMERQELLKRRRVLPDGAAEIRLDAGAPVKLRPLIEIKLLVEFH